MTNRHDTPPSGITPPPRETVTGSVALPTGVHQRTLQSSTVPLTRPARTASKTVNPLVGAARSRYAAGVPGCESPPPTGDGPPTGGEGGENVRLIVSVLRRVMKFHTVYVTQAVQGALPTLPPVLQRAIRAQLLSVGEVPEGAAPAPGQRIRQHVVAGQSSAPIPQAPQMPPEQQSSRTTVAGGPGVVGAVVEVRQHVPQAPRGPEAEVRQHVPEAPRGPEAEVRQHVPEAPRGPEAEVRQHVPQEPLKPWPLDEPHPMATMGDDSDEPAPPTQSDPTEPTPEV